MSSPTPSATSVVDANNSVSSHPVHTGGKTTPTAVSAKAKNTPTNTPSAASSPTPPSPLLIGTSFIKQYYRVLSESPQLINRYYKYDTGILSHSFLSTVPAESKTLSSVNQSNIFEWAVPSKEANPGDGIDTGGKLCFDFGRGAIDAQETIQGGILLVVTGHMKLPDTDKMKAFVHTFFLNNEAPPGKKRQLYVHNDILRVVGESDSEQILEQESSLSPPIPQQPHDSTPPTINNSVTLSTANTDETIVTAVLVKQDESEKTLKPAAQAQVIIQPKEDDSPTVSFEKPLIKEGHSNSVVHSNTTETDPPSVKNTAKLDSKRKNSSPSVVKADPVSNTNKTSVDGGGGKKKSHERSNSSNDLSPTPKEEKKSKKNKGKGGRSRKDRGRSPSSDQTDTNGAKNATASGSSSKQKESKNQNTSSNNNKPKVPGSWAGIVAGAGGPGNIVLPNSNTNNYTAPSSPSRPSAVAAAAAATAAAHLASTNSAAVEESKEGMDMDGIEKPIAATKADNGQESTQSTNSVNSRGGHPPRSNLANNQSLGSNITQRTAEATLFVKNIPDKTKEVDIRSIFEPYATTANKKILCITLHASRGFCFVDFDAKVVVDTILKDVEASKEANKANGSNGEGSKFFIYGKFLDVGRKVQVEKGRGGGGSSQHRYRNRSASPGNGAYHKPRRGDHHHRRNSPRGGNRGSGSAQQQQQQTQRNPTK